MAKKSLSDLSSFLNRWFKRIEFPFDKSAKLHIFYAVRCCLSGFSRMQVQWAVRSGTLVSGKGKRGDLSWAILVHAPVRHVTGISLHALTGEVAILPLNQEGAMKSQPSRFEQKNKAHIIEVFLKNITRSLPQFIFWKDAQSVYLGCNENFARLVGLHSPEDIAGKSDMDLNWQPTGHTADVFRRGDQETLSGHPLNNQEEILVLPSGKKLITLVSKLPILDDDNQVLGIVGYFTDITPLKKKEREFRQAKRQAEAANQAKSVFITNMSHDLRTPLTGLLGMAEMLRQEVQTAQGKAAAEDLFKASAMLLNLVNEIIDFSRCESGDFPIQEIKFDLLAVVQNMADLLKPSAQEKNLRFNIQLDERLPVMSSAIPLVCNAFC